MRSTTLHEHELGAFFARTKDIMAAHVSNARKGVAEFWLVTNAEVSEGLASRLAAEDIGLWSPLRVSRDETLFPPAHKDVPAKTAVADEVGGPSRGCDAEWPSPTFAAEAGESAFKCFNHV